MALRPWERSLRDSISGLDIDSPFHHFIPSIRRPDGSFPIHSAFLSNTNLDWKETPHTHIITADMPGMKREEIKIDVVNNATLVISGERRKEEQQSNERWHRVERSSGKFYRQLRLPEDVNVDGISAKLEKGVLSMIVPKFNTNSAYNPEVKTIHVE